MKQARPNCLVWAARCYRSVMGRLLLFGLFLYAFLRILPLPAGFRFILPDKTVSHRITPRTVFPAVIYLTGLLVSVWLIITMDVQFGIISLGVLSFVTLLRFLPKRWRLPLVIFLVLAALLIVWFCRDSEPGENQYGPNPKEKNYW